MLPDLPEGDYWPHQLIGCEVVTESGSLGHVTDLIESAANDLCTAVDDDGVETLIPTIREVVIEVNVGVGRIVVRDLPRLTTSA